MNAPSVHRTIDAVWRIESARIIAHLARMVRDVGLAEELAQDALVAALESWPTNGLPENPGAWLMSTAKRRAIDLIRRQRMIEHKQQTLRQTTPVDEDPTAELENELDDEIGDDLLRLIFTTCHPVLSTESRAALTLRLLGGLTTEEIARAFLTPEPTIAQRITRAKKTLSQEHVPIEVPRREDLPARLSSVLEVLYLIFNEGYTATAGSDWVRPELCNEALRLGRVLSGLIPDEPEVHGLASLMAIQASRIRARVNSNGEPILLMDQNRAHWDHLLIQHGLTALNKALQFPGSKGPYVCQAAIAACHARARTPEQTDWAGISHLYAELARIMPSPVVELNRAVAVMMSEGPAAGLKMLEPLQSEPILQNYHLLPSVRGDFLERMDRHNEAASEFIRAAQLTRNERERSLLLSRAKACEERAKAPAKT